MAKMRYTAGKKSVIRKHAYMPCIIGEYADDLEDGEYIELMRRCYWEDYFTVAEWKTILNDDPKNPAVHKSNIKKKVAGWLMIAGRLAVIKPQWFKEAMKFACKEYGDLVGDDLFVTLAHKLSPYHDD
jgi:hypothetical protein